MKEMYLEILSTLAVKNNVDCTVHAIAANVLRISAQNLLNGAGENICKDVKCK